MASIAADPRRKISHSVRCCLFTVRKEEEGNGSFNRLSHWCGESLNATVDMTWIKLFFNVSFSGIINKTLYLSQQCNRILMKRDLQVLNNYLATSYTIEFKLIIWMKLGLLKKKHLQKITLTAICHNFILSLLYHYHVHMFSMCWLGKYDDKIQNILVTSAHYKTYMKVSEHDCLLSSKLGEVLCHALLRGQDWACSG